MYVIYIYGCIHMYASGLSTVPRSYCQQAGCLVVGEQPNVVREFINVVRERLLVSLLTARVQIVQYAQYVQIVRYV